MKRADMLQKNAAFAQRRREQAERRAAWRAAQNAEMAASAADREAVAHLGATEAYEEIKRRRQARGARTDHDAVFSAMQLTKQKILKQQRRTTPREEHLR